MKIRDVATGRLRHSVAEAGSGDGLLLLHGFTGAKEDFADFLDGFADRGWHALAPDLRGHGASDKPTDEAEYSVAALTDDVVELLDVLGWERFDLLGHSMGGIIAQELALRQPERVRSLVLMGTMPGPTPGLPSDLRARMVELARAQGIDAVVDALATLVAGSLPPSAERVRADRPGFVEFSDRKFRAVAPSMFAAMASQLPELPDRSAALAGLSHRTLVVVGEEDARVREPSEQLAAVISGAVLEVIADAAHSPQFENPDRWWKVVSRFLEAGRADADAPPEGA